MEPNKKPENPIAFPLEYTEYNHVGCLVKRQEFGMTLRDYFAAKAMQSYIQSDELRKLCAEKGNMNDFDWTEIISENAFIIADEMLKQREL